MDVLKPVYRLLSRTHFPVVLNNEAEYKKLNYVRIIVGFIMLKRTLYNTYAAYYFTQTDTYSFFNETVTYEFLAYVVLCVALVCFIIGFLTPLATLFLLLFYTPIDILLQARYLGNFLAMITVLMLFMANVGGHLSVDRLFLKRKTGFFPSIVKAVYKLIGFRGKEGLTFVVLTGIVTYALVNFNANLFHFADPYWQEFSVLQISYTGSFLGGNPEFFRAIEASYPEAFDWFCKIQQAAHMGYEFMILPILFFIRRGWLWVFIYANLFFLATLLTMQLAVVERISFLILLCSLIRAKEEPIVHIHLVKSSGVGRFISLLVVVFDWLSAIRLMPLESPKNKILLEVKGEQADPKTALLAICRDVPILWLAFPLVWLWKKIAHSNKQSEQGAYDLAKDEPTREPLFTVTKRKRAITIFMVMYIVLGINFIFGFKYVYQLGLYFPHVRELNRKLGFEVAFVYNTPDLVTNDTWQVIYRVLDDGTKELVPLHDEVGHRLTYYQYDCVFVGVGIKWRRNLGGYNPKLREHLEGNEQSTDKIHWPYHLMRKTIKFDKLLNSEKNIDHYEVDIYHCYQSWMEKSREERYTPEVIYSYRYSSESDNFEETFRNPIDI